MDSGSTIREPGGKGVYANSKKKEQHGKKRKNHSATSELNKIMIETFLIYPMQNFGN